MTTIIDLIGDKAGDYVTALLVLALAALAIDALRDVSRDLATLIAAMLRRERDG